jgi:hypothetical protein
VGWVSLKLMSSEIAKIMGADGVKLTGRQHGSVRKQREQLRPCGVVDPTHAFARIETSRARTERPGGLPQPVGGGTVGEGDEL